jgi:hypothetical protein
MTTDDKEDAYDYLSAPMSSCATANKVSEPSGESDPHDSPRYTHLHDGIAWQGWPDNSFETLLTRRSRS